MITPIQHAKQQKQGFTPGPWKVEPDPEWAGKHAFHNHRFITAGPHALNDPEWLESPADSILCSMRDCENQEANAQLIAAAPALVEALRELLLAETEMPSHQVIIYRVKRHADSLDAKANARAALLAATGKDTL